MWLDRICEHLRKQYDCNNYSNFNPIEHIASELQINRSAVSLWKNGIRKPSIRNAKKLSRLCGYEVPKSEIRPDVWDDNCQSDNHGAA